MSHQSDLSNGAKAVRDVVYTTSPRQQSGDAPVGHYDRGIPAFESLASVLRERILSGEYQPGDRLPPAAELTRTEQVGKEVARRALRVLVAEGLARGSGGRGTRVLARPPMRLLDMTVPDPQVEARRRELGADRVEQTVEVRLPRPDEQVSHGIGERVPVFVLTTEFWAGDELLGTEVRAEPAPGMKLRYRLP